jgi:hypothetical protein
VLFHKLPLNVTFALVSGWLYVISSCERPHIFNSSLLYPQGVKSFSLIFLHYMFKFIQNMVIQRIQLWRIWCFPVYFINSTLMLSSTFKDFIIWMQKCQLLRFVMKTFSSGLNEPSRINHFMHIVRYGLLVYYLFEFQILRAVHFYHYFKVLIFAPFLHEWINYVFHIVLKFLAINFDMHKLQIIKNA